MTNIGPCLRPVLVGAFCVSFASAAFAEWISRDEAARAASAFLTGDAVGRTVLSGRMTGAVSSRGNLWVVSLVPGGSIVLSGSDILRPLVAFSPNDFTEPDAGSPFCDRLALADGEALAAETFGAAGSARHAKWTALIGSRDAVPRRATLSAPVSDEAVVVEPFLTTHWNQWQPYNDFAPVCASATDAYRGRAPCGCTATAAAQVFAYWKWPKRAETRRHAHVSSGTSGGTFDLRFHAGVPFDWDGLADAYVYRDGLVHDLRGIVPEATRFPVARLALWCDSLTEMEFGADSSSAHIITASSALADWYETPMKIIRADDAQTARDRTRSDLMAGRPVHVSTLGHALVAHGWASDGSTDYVYVNYGWGGSDDGWMPFADLYDVTVGLSPQKTVQLDPLKAVSETTVSPVWTLPACHASSVTGFRVERSEQSATPAAWAEAFSDPAGTAADTNKVHLVDDGLAFETRYANAFAFTPRFGLTTRSVLTYRMRSCYALGASVSVEIRRGDGDWQTVSTPALAENRVGSWENHRVFLGAYAGEDIAVRIVQTRVSAYYYDYDPSVFETYGCIYGSVIFSDLSLSDVLPYATAATRTCGPAERSTTFAGCTAGCRTVVKVTPLFGSAEGRSDQVATRIAGSARLPVAGSETQAKVDLSFAADDSRWSCAGTVEGTDVQTDPWDGEFAVTVDGTLRSDSVLSFGWTASGWYGDGEHDVIAGEFLDAAGLSHALFAITNGQDVTARQTVSRSLGAYAGQSGTVRVTFVHWNSTYTGYGSNYEDYGYGIRFAAPKVTNVMVPVLPGLAWEDKTFTALAQPQILSLTGVKTAVSEGFYRENALASNVLCVTCSDTVTSLRAWPSHLTLLDDGDVSVVSQGGGRFAVVFRPKAVTPERSRMILTLEARDANGSVAYKDLSLRFSSEAEPEIDVPARSDAIVVTDASGHELAVPVSWFVEKGLVASGAPLADYQAAVGADADGDGVCNWKEYVCGTDPADASDRLVCTITFVGGEVNVDYSPKTGFAPGYAAVLKGKTSLGDGEWRVRSSEHRFFRVFIERQ